MTINPNANPQPGEPKKTTSPRLPGREDAVLGFRFRWRLRSPRLQGGFL